MPEGEDVREDAPAAPEQVSEPYRLNPVAAVLAAMEGEEP